MWARIERGTFQLSYSSQLEEGNASTPNPPTAQQLNTSTTQHLNNSTSQPLNPFSSQPNMADLVGKGCTSYEAAVRNLEERILKTGGVAKIVRKTKKGAQKLSDDFLDDKNDEFSDKVLIPDMEDYFAVFGDPSELKNDEKFRSIIEEREAVMKSPKKLQKKNKKVNVARAPEPSDLPAVSSSSKRQIPTKEVNSSSPETGISPKKTQSSSGPQSIAKTSKASRSVKRIEAE